MSSSRVSPQRDNYGLQKVKPQVGNIAEVVVESKDLVSVLTKIGDDHTVVVGEGTERAVRGVRMKSSEKYVNHNNKE